MSERELRQVRKAAEAFERAAAGLERARSKRDEAIRAAVGSGEPLRDVAEAAGVSHESVRRIAPEQVRRHKRRH